MVGATQQSETQNLADLGAAYAAYRGLRQPVVFAGYREALDQLLRPDTTVIIDEFPYLVAGPPRLLLFSRSGVHVGTGGRGGGASRRRADRPRPPVSR
jgi:hypothetical protein